MQEQSSREPVELSTARYDTLGNGRAGRSKPNCSITRRKK